MNVIVIHVVFLYDVSVARWREKSNDEIKRGNVGFQLAKLDPVKQ